VSLKIALPLIFATASLLASKNCRADTYTETGDAGQLPATAQVTTTTLGPLTALTSIVGQTTQTNEIADADMFEIFISGATTFTASTTAFVPGSNDFDDQLSLFTSSGAGVLTNDDAAAGGDQASLSSAGTTLAPGDYYLLISGSGTYPVNASGTLIFPNYTDGTTDPTGTYAATGSGPITAYTGNSNEAGKYTIAISGAQFANTSLLVPEPSTVAAIVAGFGGLALALRRRRSK
jgi:hypothetical protein